MAEKERSVPKIDDLIELPVPRDVQIAPDGNHVAYTVSEPNWKKNNYMWQLWLVKVEEDATPRQLTFAKQSSHRPRWSPDGQWLAFLSRRAGDKYTQLYRMSPFGGEAERLTELKSAVNSFAWSPDGEHIAYRTVEKESEAHEEREEKYGDYHVEDEDYKRYHLWAFRLSDKKSRKLTGGDEYHVTGSAWAPDSSRLAFTARPTPDMKDWDRRRIYVVQLETLEVTPLTPEGCYSPRWSPDGKQIAFARYGTPSYYTNNQICVIDATGGKIRVIESAFDEDIYLHKWAADGLYFDAYQRTMVHLFRMDPQSGEVTQLTPKDRAGWTTDAYSFSADFKRVALIASTAERFREVGILEIEGNTGQPLTNFNNELSKWQLGKRELLQWTSQDGTEIEGVLTKPADFSTEKKYPLLVVIHGGPASASHQQLLTIHDRRYYPIQQWVGKGALVLQPNYRGSAGYGEAFRSLNVRNLGLGDYEDVISGVDALIAKGWVDPERVGAMGWSQGGYISAFITTYSERFKAVSVGAGISNWVTDYVNTDVHNFTRQYLGHTPWEDMEIYRKTSPITYIKQAKTPTLIQHGEYDSRVPVANAYELYQGLKDMGVETKLVMFPGGHNPNKPRQSRQIMQENLDWFQRWLWDEEPETEIKKPCYIVLASEEQKEDEEQLPAVQRYSAVPVQDVYHWARRDQANFRIFSAQFGLLRPDESISPDPQHALKAEAVSDMAARIAEQLKEQKLDDLVLYTPKAKKHPEVLIALGCLQVAAGIVGDITIKHRQKSEKGWGKKNNDSDDSKQETENRKQ
ncbi:MAG: prolyl oligopeptidase family serine peptidase [Ardenticatenaceae bacterium]